MRYFTGCAPVDRGQLEEDNEGHRNFSDWLDEKFGGGTVYEGGFRPLIHGAYHAGRAVWSGNGAEWDRAKDQFSKVLWNWAPLVF